MKNKFIGIFIEIVLLHLASLFLIWRLSVLSGLGFCIFLVVYLAAMVCIGMQTYYYIVKPYCREMREMKDAAEESKKAEQIRREFVANVSHELKTPLTSISGFIETLQDGAAEDPEIRTKFIDIIAIETSRLKRLIEDLLVLSDIENKKDSEFLEFDMRKAIESTVEALKPIADDKDIRIVLKFDENINIKGSADRFRQMMVNLIENAIKYSDAGSSIWVSAFDEEGKTVVSVKDEGIGIAPEHHERLFERFYRVDKSRSKKAGGTGLGLSIVKHIAVLFGATLRVESRIGAGTTFFITFDRTL
ncbi:MAG: ATP-binding protein [Bacillota bacterium]|nr:ATP-binding protein [Bacillota bacterium]